MQSVIGALKAYFLPIVSEEKDGEGFLEEVLLSEYNVNRSRV